MKRTDGPAICDAVQWFALLIAGGVVAPGPMQKEARMTRRKSKIADPRASKGKGQLTMLRVMTHEEAAAAE